MLIPELTWVVEDQILSTTQHQVFAATDMSQLAQIDALPVGFLVAETLGSLLFIAKLSLHLERQGKGISRRLVEYTVEQAHKKGYTSLTLTTFCNMTWNAPWYARLGLEILVDETLPAELRQKREEEVVHRLAFESHYTTHLMLC